MHLNAVKYWQQFAILTGGGVGVVCGSQAIVSILEKGDKKDLAIAAIDALSSLASKSHMITSLPFFKMMPNIEI